MAVNQSEHIKNFVRAGLWGMLICVLGSSALAKGKSEPIDPLTVDIWGGLDAAESVEAHGVSTSGGKKNPILEVVVRNVDLTFVFGRDSGLEGFDVCFAESDAGAAGKFRLYQEGQADFQVFPEYLDKNGEHELYELFLEGTHTLPDEDIADFPANGAVSFTADFDSVEVSTDARGHRRDACTGNFDWSSDGFEAAASFDRL